MKPTFPFTATIWINSENKVWQTTCWTMCQDHSSGRTGATVTHCVYHLDWWLNREHCFQGFLNVLSQHSQIHHWQFCFAVKRTSLLPYRWYATSTDNELKTLQINWLSNYISKGKTEISCWPFKHSLETVRETEWYRDRQWHAAGSRLKSHLDHCG